jgi:NTE family protein
MALLEGLLRRGRGGDRPLEGDVEFPPPLRGRPTIGIALSGGAARGFAHIGVLRTLAAHGIKPDVVTASSMGSVIGGCYAAGRLDPFADWALSLTVRRVLGYIDPSLSGSGLLRGSRLARQLELNLGQARIEDLETRFAAIATEIETGHEVWLTRGRLIDAVRASYALPGLFAPVRIGGRWLLDGALVNPIPVSAARALDARLVIGVNTNADVFGRGATIPNHGLDEEELAIEGEIAAKLAQRGWRGIIGARKLLKRQLIGRPGLPTIMIEAYNVMQDRITRARLAGDPADIMITPRVGHIGMFEFHRAEEAIRIGADAAERALDQIEEAIEALA